MVIVKLTGGLGNQLFIYAAGRALAKRLKTTLKFDSRYYLWVRNRSFRLNMFNTIGSGLTFPGYIGLIRPKAGYTEFKEKIYYSYDIQFEKLKGNVYLDGWWQNPHYFQSVKRELQKEFSFHFQQSKELKKLMHRISRKTTVSIHIRRGDYTKLDAFGICSPEYYKKAIHFIKNKIKNCTFVVFSDDQVWAKETFSSLTNAIFVNNLSHEVEDLYAMSRCTHHIIANSTFSWWGSVLAKDQSGITIAPSPWVNYEKKNTKDLYMKNWILLPRD